MKRFQDILLAAAAVLASGFLQACGPDRNDSYSVIFLPDCHLCNAAPQKYDLKLFDSLAMPLYTHLYDSLSARGKVVTVNLGDLSHDRYWYVCNYSFKDAYAHLLQAGVKQPLFSVMGNHDHDPSVTGPDPDVVDRESAREFCSICGPEPFSERICGDLWMFMDNMKYINTPDPSSTVAGVKGRRNYNTLYSDSQMEWLEGELASAAPGSTVYLCSHGPLFDAAGLHHPAGQLRQLDSMLAAHNLTMEFFAGHAHRMENALRPEYPRIRVHVLPAVSGNMWECDDHVVGLDGSEGGLAVLRHESGTDRLTYNTYSAENAYFRIYDMNDLACRWSADGPLAWIRKAIDDYVDYTDPAFADCVLVNFWTWSEGQTLEVMCDGQKLDVMRAPFSVDPTSLESHFTFRRDRYEGTRRDPVRLELAFSNLFYAKTGRCPGAELVVRAMDADGRLIAEQSVIIE